VRPKETVKKVSAHCSKERRWTRTKKRLQEKRDAHALAFGVAFLGVAFFLGVVAFFAGAAAFFAAGSLVLVALAALGEVAAGALVLVTRPDLVLPRTRDTSSSTAGAEVAAALRGLLALALGLAAGAALVAVAAVVAFLGRPVAFLGAAAALVAVAVVVVALAFSFCEASQ